MSYQALARKWRPRSFDQVIGQDHVVSALSNALNNQRVHHAFLFTGTRGVGKTTLARIFAKALNCEKGVSADPCGECNACQSIDRGNFVDLIEVDAASRTKVDDTRELLDNVQYTPTQGRYKIYLIDEVHMLSTHSFNALLKTLEEPPEHVKFLLATTDPQKLPTTILSRCIQFNLKSMDVGRLVNQLEKILDAENIPYEAAGLMILARSANGSVRDALSLLDQAIAFGDGEVNAAQVRKMLGMIDDRYIYDLFERLCANKAAGLLATVSDMAERSVDFSTAIDELLTLIHNLSLFLVSAEAVEWKGLDSSRLERLSGLADAETLQLFYQIGLIGKKDLPLAPDPRTGFEMTLLRMVAFQPAMPGPVSTGNNQLVAPKNTEQKENTDKIPLGAVKEQALSSENIAVEDSEKAEGKIDLNRSAEVAERPPETGDNELNVTQTGSAGQEEGAFLSGADTNRIDHFTPEKLSDIQGWYQFVERAGLSGMTKEAVTNMVPKSVEGRVVTLLLDNSHKHLLNAGRIKKIEQHCREKLDLDVVFEVEIAGTADNGRETLSQKKGRERKQRESDARQAFVHDPNVQELVDLFDAEIVTDSIRPSTV